MAQQRPKSEEQAQAMAEAMIAKIEGARRDLIERLAASAQKDADRSDAEVNQLKQLGVDEQRIATVQRRAAGLNRLRDFTVAATKLKDAAPPNGIVFTGRIEKPDQGKLQIRLTDSSGKEVANVPVEVGDKGEFIANIAVEKLGAGDVVATIVNAKGESLRESIPVRLAAGIVHTLDVLRKKK